MSTSPKPLKDKPKVKKGKKKEDYAGLVIGGVVCGGSPLN